MYIIFRLDETMPYTNPNKRFMHTEGHLVTVWKSNTYVIYGFELICESYLRGSNSYGRSACVKRSEADWRLGDHSQTWTHYSSNILQIHFYLRFEEIS